MKIINLILILTLSSFLFAQEKVIVYDNKINLRQIANDEFGDPNLWQYILVYNNLGINSTPQNGKPLIIPSKKIKDLINKFMQAETSVKNAVDIGAKVLAEDLINPAISKLNVAYKLKREFEIEKLYILCDEIIREADNAYKRTKEIREKTIDAILSYKVGTVQKLLPSTIKWNDINLLENLKENDFARTLSMSLAKITFYDLSQIKLNENSQAIIQHSKYDPLTKKGESKVKVEKGDAYAMLSSSPKKKFDLEIKGVKTKINSKYFWFEKTNNGAKFSNYNGTIEVASNDSVVSIKRNEGTIVEENKPPLPAIQLLAPPTLITPNDKDMFSISSVLFSWSKVDNAKSYWLEIASDDSFKTIVSQIKNIDTTIVGVKNISDGIKYWRVCSIDKNGLPGLYSDPKIFVVKSNSLLPQLIIHHPKDYTYTKDSALNIKGKTDENCVVSVNGKKIETTNNIFEHKIILLGGFNRINISSTNRSEKTNSVLLNVYYENNPEVELFDGVNSVKNELTKKTNSNLYELKLITRPYSSIKLINLSNNKEQITYSDSLGNFYFLININDDKEFFKMIINTKAGFNREVKLILNKDTSYPEIQFKEEIPQFYNSNNITIMGKVFDCYKLKINNNIVSFDENGNFLFNLTMNAKENLIHFEAEDDAGNIKKVIKKIYFDNNPPVYLRHKLVLIDKTTNLFELSVYASDDFNLIKTSIAEIQIGNSIIKEVLIYNFETKRYETKFLVSSYTQPKLISVTLKDEAGNQKLYQLNK